MNATLLFSNSVGLAMSFRRDKQRALGWQTWLEKNREELVACGIPIMLLEESGPWYYFLDHGYYTPLGNAGPIIDVNSMSKANAERLCSFLEQDDLYPRSATLRDLRCILQQE